MGRFLESEKARQAIFKHSQKYFSNLAQDNGEYSKKPRAFCLPIEVAEENLYAGIRHDAMEYFKNIPIKWHQGYKDKPSNHLCSSQVCCINFLYPFTYNSQALKSLLLPIYPDISVMLPVENGHYVAFEWIGQKDYLNENNNRKKRTRGANATSSDAFVLFEKNNGERQAVLIEWKYTESYSRTLIATAKSGTERTKTYQRYYNMSDCYIDKSYGNYIDFFYEPFYQLLRQQLLAQEMEKNEEFNANTVSTLHIAPAVNFDFKKVTSLGLTAYGDSPTEIWSRIIKSNRFTSVYTETLFGNFPVSQYPELQEWWQYITERYGWLITQ